MKKFRLFAMLLALALTCGFVTSCSDDDDGPGSKSDLIGLWELTHYIDWEKVDGQIIDQTDEDDNTLRYRFMEDGTVIEYEYDSYRGSWDHYVSHGVYQYKDGKLSIAWNDDPDDFESAKVTTLNSTTLVFEGSEKEREDGHTYEYYTKQTYRKISD